MIDSKELKRLEEETVMIITNEKLKKMSNDPLFEGQTEPNENFDYKSFWSIDGKIYQVNRNMYDFVARSQIVLEHLCHGHLCEEPRWSIH